MPHTALASASGKCLLGPRALRFKAAEMRVGPHAVLHLSPRPVARQIGLSPVKEAHAQ